jgi:hypothetical protein
LFVDETRPTLTPVHRHQGSSSLVKHGHAGRNLTGNLFTGTAQFELLANILERLLAKDPRAVSVGDDAAGILSVVDDVVPCEDPDQECCRSLELLPVGVWKTTVIRTLVQGQWYQSENCWRSLTMRRDIQSHSA